jgi:hypothetical protein
MKAKFIIIILVLLSVVLPNNNLRAQENKKNVLTLSLTNLCILTPTLYYERVIGEKTSIQLGAYYTGVEREDVKFSGLGVIPEFRFYPGSYGAPRGFYCAPYVKYQNYSQSKTIELAGIPSRDAKATLTGIGGGLIIGGQIYAADVVVLDVFIGPSVTSWSTDYKGDATEDDFGSILGIKQEGTNVGIRFGMSLGFGF